LKLETIVVIYLFYLLVLDSLSKPIDFGFKRPRVSDTGSSFRTFGTPFLFEEQMQLQSSNWAQMHYGRLLPADQKLCLTIAGITELITWEKLTPLT